MRGSETGGVGGGAACRSAALPARVPPVRPRPLCLILARCRSPPGSRGAARRLGEARRPGSGVGVVSVAAACAGPMRGGRTVGADLKGVEQQVQRPKSPVTTSTWQQAASSRLMPLAPPRSGSCWSGCRREAASGGSWRRVHGMLLGCGIGASRRGVRWVVSGRTFAPSEPLDYGQYWSMFLETATTSGASGDRQYMAFRPHVTKSSTATASSRAPVRRGA